MSGRNGFLMGVATAAVVAALAFAATRYRGSELSQPAAPPQQQQQQEVVAPPVAMPAAIPGSQNPHAAPAEPASSDALIAGTLSLDAAAAKSVNGPVTVFVIARGGTGKGHPVLAKRIDVASFPAPFALTASDSMMGDAPPDHLSLEARVDLDRDAMTKEPNAPAVHLDSVAIGSKNVALTLK